jgi:predicted AlkP superfamily phosphohydrolase/phosphomutase
MLKLVIVGLDGATWNILNHKKIKQHIPTINKIIKSGVSADLKSSLPSVTFPAWKCITTGRNPGKLGVYWWTRFDKKNNKIFTENSKSFKGKEIWDYLTIKGLKSVAINVPTTYPPKRINGSMISGAIVSNDDEYSYPPELKTEIQNKLNYDLSVNVYDIEDVERKFESRFKLANYLQKKNQPNFLMTTIFSIDQIQHKFYDNINTKNNKIEQAWKIIDDLISKYIRKNPDTIFFFVSDHGFTEAKVIFQLNQWLADKNYLYFLEKSEKRDMVGKKIGKLFNKENEKNLYNRFRMILRNVNKKEFVKQLLVKGGRRVFNINFKRLFASIDWKQTKVFGMHDGIVYFNMSNMTNEEKLEIQDKIISELKNLKEPTFQIPIIKNVWKPEEIYDGKYLENAPDLIIEPTDGIVITAGILSHGQIWSYPSELKENWTGCHKRNGIYFAIGPGIKKGVNINSCSLYDIAPTVLHIFGLSIPNDMDGKVLTEIFEDGSEYAKREIDLVDPLFYEKDLEKDKIKDVIKNLNIN